MSDWDTDGEYAGRLTSADIQRMRVRFRRRARISRKPWLMRVLLNAWWRAREGREDRVRAIRAGGLIVGMTK